MDLRRIVDLSHPIEDGMPIYPGDPEVTIRPAATIERDGYNVLHVSMGSQSGTHVDAPYHFVAAGARIDEFDPSAFVGPATIVDVRHRGARSPITWADLAPVSDQLGSERSVILHTGWSRDWGTARYLDHPYLDAGAARRLVDAGVRTVGIDALSIDETVVGEGTTGDFAAHDVLLGAGVVVVENLTGLDQIDWPEPWVSILPLRLRGGDGAPARAVAMEFVAGRPEVR